MSRTERSVLFLRRLTYQSQPHSFSTRAGFVDGISRHVDISGDQNAILRDPVKL
jgi:hypothetical protein